MPGMHLIISGIVHGVFFRASAKQKADQLGITGWVRNTDDGAVEIHVEGDPLLLEAFTDWCSEGPEDARVQGMEVAQCPEEQCSEFTIRK